MARDIWFETVAIAQQRARNRLPKSVHGALVAASEKGVTASDNVESFAELGFAPHVIGAPEKRDLATTVMGQQISMPVIISPTGVQAVHPDGEVAVARVPAARGTAMGLSAFASKPIEEVVAVNDKIFFQTYWLGDRAAIAARAERARGRRRRRVDRDHRLDLLPRPGLGQPLDPQQMDLATMVKMMPEALTRPRWLWQWGKTLNPPNLRVPNQAACGEAGPRDKRGRRCARDAPGCLLAKFWEINRCPCFNNQRIPGEFGLPSARGFP